MFMCTDGDSGHEDIARKDMWHRDSNKPSTCIDEFYGVEEGSDLYNRWCVKVGTALARELFRIKGSEHYVYLIHGFPGGYQLVRHVKHTARQTADDMPREDTYLLGRADGRKYRSTQEFIPHAKWLMKGMKGTCTCKYC
jgi:hypothetical protein